LFSHWRSPFCKAYSRLWHHNFSRINFSKPDSFPLFLIALNTVNLFLQYGVFTLPIAGDYATVRSSSAVCVYCIFASLFLYIFFHPRLLQSELVFGVQIPQMMTNLISLLATSIVVKKVSTFILPQQCKLLYYLIDDSKWTLTFDLWTNYLRSLECTILLFWNFNRIKL